MKFIRSPLPLGSPTTEIPRGGYVIIVSRPQVRFRVCRIIVPSDYGRSVVVQDILASDRSHLPAPIMATDLSERATYTPFDFIVEKGYPLKLHVINIGRATLVLNMVALGENLDEAAIDPIFGENTRHSRPQQETP